MGDKREFGCPRERKRHGQSCVSVTCSRTLSEDEDGRKGCSEKFGLCPEGDTDPGLNGMWPGPHHGCGEESGVCEGCCSFSQTPAQAVCLQGCSWRKSFGACEGSHPAGEGFGLQRRRSRVTDTTTWQHSCLKIEETEIKSGWCKCHRGDLLKT